MSNQDVLPESQYGIRSNGGTIDMTFVVRQLQEKSKNIVCPSSFTTWKRYLKASAETLGKLLAKFGLPPRYFAVVRALHDGMTGHVLHHGVTSPVFPIQTGVKQDVSWLLFSLYLAALYQTPSSKVSTRLDGCISNLSRVRATSNCLTLPVNELQCADDAAVPSHDLEHLQEITSNWVSAYEAFGLRVNKKETQTLYQAPPGTIDRSVEANPVIVDGTGLESVTTFPSAAFSPTRNPKPTPLGPRS